MFSTNYVDNSLLKGSLFSLISDSDRYWLEVFFICKQETLQTQTEQKWTKLRRSANIELFSTFAVWAGLGCSGVWLQFNYQG